MDPSGLRETYERASLDEADLDPDPIGQFRSWFELAVSRSLPEPNAMTLASATKAGRPSSRIVLLKGFDARGFVFFTNYDSRKGTELDANPFAALTFFYPTLERQVRVEGAVERVSAEESDLYFLGRPRGSRLGAWASHQSQPVADRATLDARLAALERRYPGDDIPRPPNWGGYRVIPDRLEFWQGRPNRLHDRLVYQRDGTSWRIERLEP